MQEIFEKIKERLEEKYVDCNKNMCLVKDEDGTEAGHVYDEYLNKSIAYEDAIEIVNQAAEEYEECYKDCGECEAYDKEKHHCPKFCKVITEAVAEIEENHSDFCEWEEKAVDIKNGQIQFVKEPHRLRLLNSDDERKFCPYCGKKIKVAPYQPKGE